MEWLFEPFQHVFMQRALAACVIMPTPPSWADLPGMKGDVGRAIYNGLRLSFESLQRDGFIPAPSRCCAVDT